MKKLLIVEDEEAIVRFIKNRLDTSSYHIDIAMDGKEATEFIRKESYDLITLDIMLPFVDGFDLSKLIREKSARTLIIVVSALDTVEFKARGYVYGIDDYIAKPFSAKELALKIDALLKRREALMQNRVQKGGVVIDDEAKEVRIDGIKIDLTPSEYVIIQTLALYKQKVFSRRDLAQVIYDAFLGEIEEKGINSHIYHMREKIKAVTPKEVISTVRGMGYKIAD